MRQRLNSEGHDESQYLPKTWYNPKTQMDEPYPVVNAFRAAKGDIVHLQEDGEVARALVWLPHALHLKLDHCGQRIISSDHLHTCETLNRVLRIVKVALGLSDLRAYTDGQAGEMAPSAERDIFVELIKGLPVFQGRVGFWFAEADFTPQNSRAALQWLGAIYAALDSAQNIIDATRESDNMSIVASPEVCPELTEPAR